MPRCFSRLSTRGSQSKGHKSARLHTTTTRGPLGHIYDKPHAFNTHLQRPYSLQLPQAAALGLPHAVCTVEGPDYEAAYRANIAALKADHGIDALVTGDIVDVCNGFMCRAVAGSGVELWCGALSILWWRFFSCAACLAFDCPRQLPCLSERFMTRDSPGS